ncbi:MAG: hypothetical protein KDD66_07680 [Bdellovibrionales bacterium]|nr:hypothetical protein [Bdellovibrionales bacterium]
MTGTSCNDLFVIATLCFTFGFYVRLNEYVKVCAYYAEYLRQGGADDGAAKLVDSTSNHIRSTAADTGLFLAPVLCGLALAYPTQPVPTTALIGYAVVSLVAVAMLAARRWIFLRLLLAFPTVRPHGERQKRYTSIGCLTSALGIFIAWLSLVASC